MFSGEQEMDPKKWAEISPKCENIPYEDAFLGGTFIRRNLITYRIEVKNFKMQIHIFNLSEAWLDK